MLAGPTYTEEYRHACEVRWVVAQANRSDRVAYLEAVRRRRGDAAADKLRADVIAAWEAAHRQGEPRSPVDQGGDAPAHCSEAQAAPMPGGGSFPDACAEGSSDPVAGVVSDLAAS